MIAKARFQPRWRASQSALSGPSLQDIMNRTWLPFPPWAFGLFASFKKTKQKQKQKKINFQNSVSHAVLRSIRLIIRWFARATNSKTLANPTFPPFVVSLTPRASIRGLF